MPATSRPAPRSPLRALAGASARGDAHVGARAVPALRRARRRQDAPGARARPRAAAPRARTPRRRRLPDDAADAPVGAGRRRRSACTSRPTPTELRPPRDFHGVAVTYARVARRGRALGAQCARAHARDRRRGAPPRRRARLGRGLRGARSRSRATLAAAVRHAVSLRRHARSPACATTTTASRGPTSPTRYADAVRDGICRPVTFVPYDGTLQWQQRRRRRSRPRSTTC